MITIEVETLKNCREDCPYFTVSGFDVLYADGRIAHRVYKCTNLELCKQLKEEANND